MQRKVKFERKVKNSFDAKKKNSVDANQCCGKENMWTYLFINFFLFLWVIFALLDPDPVRIRNTYAKKGEEEL